MRVCPCAGQVPAVTWVHSLGARPAPIQVRDHLGPGLLLVGWVTGPVASFALLALILARHTSYHKHREDLLTALKLLRIATAARLLWGYQNLISPAPPEPGWWLLTSLTSKCERVVCWWSENMRSWVGRAARVALRPAQRALGSPATSSVRRAPAAGGAVQLTCFMPAGCPPGQLNCVPVCSCRLLTGGRRTGFPAAA